MRPLYIAMICYATLVKATAAPLYIEEQLGEKENVHDVDTFTPEGVEPFTVEDVLGPGKDLQPHAARGVKLVDAGIYGAIGGTHSSSPPGELYLFKEDVTQLPIPSEVISAFKKNRKYRDIPEKYRIKATADNAPVSAGDVRFNGEKGSRIAVWRHGKGPPKIIGSKNKGAHHVEAVSPDGRYVAGRRMNGGEHIFLCDTKTGDITIADTPKPVGDIDSYIPVKAVSNEGEILCQIRGITPDSWPNDAKLTGSLGAVWNGERYIPLMSKTDGWHVLIRNPAAWTSDGVTAGTAFLTRTDSMYPNAIRQMVRYSLHEDTVECPIYDGVPLAKPFLKAVDINENESVLAERGVVWHEDGEIFHVLDKVEDQAEQNYRFLAITDEGELYANSVYNEGEMYKETHHASRFVPRGDASASGRNTSKPEPSPKVEPSKSDKYRKLAIFFHGWRATQFSIDDMVGNIVYETMKDRVRDEWKFVVIDWSEEAGLKKGGFARFGPRQAAQNGIAVGRETAAGWIHSDLEVVRVYGHSAGRYPANMCARKIKQKTDAHVTAIFLDAYEAHRPIPGAKPAGKGLDRAIHYIDSYKRDAERDLVFLQDGASWALRKAHNAKKGSFELAGVTGPVYEHCVNIDITDLIPPKDREKKMKDLSVLQIVQGSLFEPWSRHHAWPVKAYSNGVLEKYSLGTDRGEDAGEPYGSTKLLGRVLNGKLTILKKNGPPEIRDPFSN